MCATVRIVKGGYLGFLKKQNSEKFDMIQLKMVILHVTSILNVIAHSVQANTAPLPCSNVTDISMVNS